MVLDVRCEYLMRINNILSYLIILNNWGSFCLLKLSKQIQGEKQNWLQITENISNK